MSGETTPAGEAERLSNAVYDTLAPLVPERERDGNILHLAQAVVARHAPGARTTQDAVETLPDPHPDPRVERLLALADDAEPLSLGLAEDMRALAVLFAPAMEEPFSSLQLAGFETMRGRVRRERESAALPSRAPEGEVFADEQQSRIDALEDWQREVCRLLTPETEDRGDLFPDCIPARIEELLEIERAHGSTTRRQRWCADLECYGLSHPDDTHCVGHGLPLGASRAPEGAEEVDGMIPYVCPIDGCIDGDCPLCTEVAGLRALVRAYRERANKAEREAEREWSDHAQTQGALRETQSAAIWLFDAHLTRGAELPGLPADVERTVAKARAAVAEEDRLVERGAQEAQRVLELRRVARASPGRPDDPPFPGRFPMMG